MVFHSELLPEGNRHYRFLVLLEHVAVLPANFHQFPNVFGVDLDSFVAQFLELVVLDVQAVSGFLLPWVINVSVSRFRVQRD